MSTYSVSTTEMDIEDGYPEYSAEVTTLEALRQVAEEAEAYGIPVHRLTVLECFDDDEIDEFMSEFAHLGSLEEVLRGLK